MPSNRKFGWFFTAVFTLLALFLAWKNVVPWAFAASAVALALAAASLLCPDRLSPLNKAWFALGLLLGKVVSPIVLGIIFFLLISPVALITRASGRDVLRIKRRPQTTYWITRTPPGPAPESFKNQF